MPEQPGWYQDPANPDGARWWDGNRWTSEVRAATPPPSPSGQGTAVAEAQRAVPGWEPPPARSHRLPGPDNWLTNNVVSLCSMLAAVVFGVVLLQGGIFVFGFLPIALAVFAYKLHERLAVAAVVVAALVFVANIVASINFF